MSAIMSVTLRKLAHAINRDFYVEKNKFSIEKNVLFFLIFLLKHRTWIHVTTRTHDLCFGAK